MEKGSCCKPLAEHHNLIIDSLCKDKMVDQALELFAKMIEKGIRADVITYSFLIHGLCIFRRETEAAKLLIDMEEKGIPPDIHTYTILVNAFCKQGPVKDAELAV
ncbi:putative tetratricopeptide-like helical domain-containing protein, partial [Tanacetum coccineum]